MSDQSEMKRGKQVFISRQLPDLAPQLLEEAGFTIKMWQHERPMHQEELITAVQKVDALLCTSADKIDDLFFRRCSHLEIISTFAVGYDNIDVSKAHDLQIPIGHTPGVLTDATADIAFALLLAVARKMCFQHKRIVSGNWKYFIPTAYLGLELKNKTLGIFGLGAIGLEMAKRCQAAYQMPVIYHNRNRNLQAETKVQADYVNFRELLQRSDILSVHASLNEQNRGIFNADTFHQMKPTSIFLNTARGALHHEADLIEALQSQTIWGAGLDVTNPEPMQPDNPLLQMENVAVLPHIGSATVQARDGMARLAAENIISFYRSGQVLHAAGRF